ncbi:hypothetical protein N8D74_10065 [Curtobacterium flaccumfaciens]|uniref:Uncharacterized protein n=1 Tax=Curtobacterium poinsettiae TaxID=159612 RepID=A0A9Q9T3W9_9MICO|nr:hypothetical protein [Curtobacterium flaccumfaciens]UXN23929.1 hypothetical protein N8D74_10065 [Curtobacterium flaccumfaciens]UYC82044.1 hypothetical protein OE229_06150 [Curtobacterium flaccumfaciens pv. poinsettiae]
MTNSTFPFGGSFVSGIDGRDVRGSYTGRSTTEPSGTYTGVPVAGRLGRFVDTQRSRPGTVTASTRTVTGSFRTATGSFRTA